MSNPIGRSSEKLTESDQQEDFEEDLAPVIIECANRSDLKTSWIVTVFWGALSAYVLTRMDVASTDWQRDGPLVGAMLLIFAGGTLILMLGSILATLRWRKFGQSLFELKGPCGIVGQKLQGTIRSSRKFQPSGPYELTLENLETETYRTTKGTKKTSTVSLWKETKTLPERFHSTTRGIPVDFDIPATCRGCGDTNSKGRISWTLSVWAPVAGVNYRAPFDVPIYSQDYLSED